MNYLAVLCFVLFHIAFITCNVVKGPTVADATSEFHGLPKMEDTSNTELGKKVAELKKQALAILALKGVKNLDQKANIKSGISWDDIKVSKELYEGIKRNFDEEETYLKKKRVGVRTTAPDFKLIPLAKWSMPIQFTTSLIKSSALKNNIRKAVKEIEDKTGGCITFVEVSSAPSKSYIQYKEVQSLGEGVCAQSYLGRQSDVNVIDVSTTCQVYGTLVHETLHSLGFAHTHQRPDASQYVSIQWSNLVQDANLLSNFQPWQFALKNQGPFDYGSIMMYPAKAFSRNGGETITPKENPTYNRQLMGQRVALSTEDANILMKVYCGANTPTGASCKDKSTLCPSLKSSGHCVSSSPIYLTVVSLCPLTCKKC